MGYASLDALMGANDLKEKDVNLPSLDMKVRVRALPAAFSNQASSESLKMVTDARGEQTSKVDMNKLEVLTVLHGLQEPRLDTYEQAEALSQKLGPAWETIVKAIRDLSPVTEEAVQKKAAQFQVREREQNGGDPQGEKAADPARGG